MLTNLGLVDFVFHYSHYYLDLVRVFYSNLRISDNGVIHSEVKNVKMTISPNLFYSLTDLSYVGLHFEGDTHEQWSNDYHTLDAGQIICNPKFSGRILARFMKVDTQILHYVT